MSTAQTTRSAATQRIGRYELKAKAGEGASGVVYRAYDPLLDRDTAIKLARTNVLTETEIRRIVEEFHHEDPRPMTELNPQIPQPVVELVARAMAKADADRFPSAAAFAHAIHDVSRALYPASRLLDNSHRYLQD